MPRGVLEMQLPQHPAVAQHSDAVTALTELATQPLYLICRSGARICPGGRVITPNGIP